MSVKRLEFAHQLRAIAALLVVVSHYIGVFWISPKAIGYLVGVPPLPVGSGSLSGAQLILDQHVFFGQFGVAVFFLISGFLIPLSLENKSPRRFIIERLFRIYPVYIAGFSLCILSSLLVSSYFSGNYNFSFSQILVHYFLVIREWIGSPKIDGISWTLEIELKFYLYILILTFFLRKYPVLMLIISLILLFTLSAYLFTDKSTWYIGRQISCIQYMFIGVAFSYYYKRNISMTFLNIYILTSMILFTAVFINTFLYERYTGWLTGYWIALLIFYLSFVARARFHPSKILSHFADISYPLYATHALTGYALLYFLVKNNVPPWGAVAFTFLIIYALSVLIHLFLEKPALHYGRRIAQQ